MAGFLHTTSSKQLRSGLRFLVIASRRCRDRWPDTAQMQRRRLAVIVDELAARGELPTFDDLRVAWDRSCASGRIIDTSPPWSLIELWVDHGDHTVPTPEPTPAEALATAIMQVGWSLPS